MRGFRIEDGVPWVGDRSFPWASRVESEDMELSSLPVYRRRGFQLRFETGCTLSVIWGSGTYSANHEAILRDQPFRDESPTAEVAAWDLNEESFEWPDGGTVQGYWKPEGVLVVVDLLAEGGLEALRWPLSAVALSNYEAR